MRSRLRNCEPPAISPGFLRDLRMVAPEFYPKWHLSGRWMIVKDVPRHISRRGYIVEFVVHDGKGGYAPLDQKVIDCLMQAKQERDKLDNPEKLLRKFDEEEELKMREALKLRAELQLDFSKKVCKFLTSKTFT